MTDLAPRPTPATGGSITGAFRDEMRTSFGRTVRGWRPISELLALLRFGERVVAGMVRTVLQRRFPGEEYVRQTWFVVKVCTLPSLSVSIPFGVILALQVGVLAQEVGATGFTGAGNTLAVVRQAPR